MYIVIIVITTIAEHVHVAYSKGIDTLEKNRLLYTQYMTRIQMKQLVDKDLTVILEYQGLYYRTS